MKLEQEPKTKEARSDDDGAMDCIASMVVEAVGYTGKALSTVSEAMHEHEPGMVLNTLTPTTQQEARMSEIESIEKQGTVEEVYYEQSAKVIRKRQVGRHREGPIGGQSKVGAARL